MSLLEFYPPAFELYSTLCSHTRLPEFVYAGYGWVWESLDASAHPWRFVTLLTMLQHMILFWGYNLPLLYLDVYKSPKWLYKYKIQKTSHSSATLWHCFRFVLRNQLMFMVPSSLLLYPIFKARGQNFTPQTLPSGFEIFVDLLIAIVIEEIGFYYSHRVLHWPFFYKHIHKLHHEFKAPVGMAAIYAHPVEFILSNIGPLVAGSVVAKAHVFSAWVWLFVALVGTINHHSGYAFPWLIGTLNPHHHDYHHYRFDQNYGLLGWLDTFHNTNKGYEEYMVKNGFAKQNEKENGIDTNGSGNDSNSNHKQVAPATPPKDAVPSEGRTTRSKKRS
jgi:methylsterol monooxygenase